MLIKIVQNGMESEWFPLTKKTHRELMQKKPEAAIVHIEDVYPDSPDAGRVIRLDFRLFTVLTREFKLEDLKQEKHDERHVEKLRLEARPANAPDYGIKNYNKKEIPLNQGIPSKLPVKNGRKSTCALSAPASTSLYISPTEKTRCIISLSPSLTAPVQKGTAVGSVVLYIDSKPYRSYPIYARQSIKKRTFAWYYKRMFYYLIH